MPSVARSILVAALLLPMPPAPSQAATPASAFTYQGQLAENDAPADGSYDFQLALYDQDSGGSAVAVNTFEDVPVSNGLFQLSPDFTSAPFEAGLAYWVEARVRPGSDTGAFTPLLPRQAITASPYALVAQAVLAPLDVPGDASVQGDLQVNGEVRAGRVEADEIWSDGAVDFVNGASIGGGLQLGGAMNCTVAGGCVGLDALVPTLYADRSLIDWRESSMLIVSSDIEDVTASCADANDLLLFGICPTGGFGAIVLHGSNVANRADPTQPLGYTCRYLNGFGSSQTATAVAACLKLNP